MQAAPLVGSNGHIEGTTDYRVTAGSSLVVITSGVPRKPGMSREQLLETNARIVRDVVKQVATGSPNAILVVVTNPLDAMTYVAHKVSKFPRERVMGMAGVLDSARLQSLIAAELKVSVITVLAMAVSRNGE